MARTTRSWEIEISRQSAIEGLISVAALPALLLVMWTMIGFFGLKTYTQLQSPASPLPAATRKAPSCGVTTVDALRAINLAPTRTFSFDGATYGLHRGQAECVFSQARGPMDRNKVAYCQFSAPGGLEVEKDGKAHVFAPGPTKPATVWFVDGEPRCVSDSDLNTTRRLEVMRRQ